MAIAISRALHDRLLALAAADQGREVCGLLFGTPEAIEAIRPCANVSPSPRDSFEIDPAALIAAYKAERAGGPKVIGCYHSHPNGRAEPSSRDFAAATIDSIWLIISADSVSGWRHEPSNFVQLAIVFASRVTGLHHDSPSAKGGAANGDY